MQLGDKKNLKCVVITYKLLSNSSKNLLLSEPWTATNLAYS